MRQACPLIGALLLFALPVHAQLPIPDQPPEWGEVSKEVLRVEDYPADSNASAVILADHGHGHFERDGEFELQRHTRIKILDEGGYESGTVVVPYYAEDGIQNVMSVEGATYTLKEGTVQKHELDDDDVFTEDLDGGIEQIRFTLPNLEPGAVIEYRYDLESEGFVQIPGWNFQHAQPTLYSEYAVHFPDHLEYVALRRGSQRYDSIYTKREGVGRSAGFEKHWVMKDVPALREEPYMTTPEDYRSQIRPQAKLLRSRRTGKVIERFMSSWPDFAETILEADYFGKGLGEGGGGLFGGDGAVAKEVSHLTEGVQSDAAKMRAIYDYVQSSIEWTGETSRWRDKSFEEILESKTGNSAEVNLLLVSLLQNAGIEAHPVLLSTREHGRTIPGYPIIRQFNTVIAAVQLPDRRQRVLLDATEPLCPPSLLPKRNLNQQGWLVRKENPIWIGIPAPAANRQVYVRGTLQPDGTLKGNLSVQDRGYEALQTRQALQDKDPSTIIKDRILKHHSSVSLSDVSVKNRDSIRAPLKLTATLKSPGYAQATGPMLYVNPRVAAPVEENPFTLKKRTFPVDFAYPRKTRYILSLRLPDGYEVKDIPQSRKVKLPKNDGMFTRLIQSNHGQVSIRSVKHISTPRIPPSRYKSLRKFYTKMVSAHSKQIVLEKTGTGAASSSSGDEE